MATAAVPEIHLIKLGKEYFRAFDQVDSKSAAVSDDDINVDNITLEAISTEWVDMSQPVLSTPFTRTVNITKLAGGDADSKAFGQVRTFKVCENVVRVTLESGHITGTKKMFNIPLEGTDQELIQEFGPYLEVDPSKTMSEAIYHQIKLDVSLEQDIDTTGASVIVQSTEKTCSWRFNCKVEMDGKIMRRLRGGVREERISDVIKSLKKSKDSQDSVAAFSITGKNLNAVVFTMTGEVEFKWDYEHNFEWKNTPVHS